MLSILPALALRAGEPLLPLVLPRRPQIIIPTEEERASFDPSLAILPLPSPLLLGGGGGASGGVFLVGNNAAATTNTGAFGDNQQGIGVQASASGTANSFVIRGNSGLAFPSVVFRLCVYAATSSTVWSGALLGKTADITGLGTTDQSFALLAPITITSGNWYALTVHCGTAGNFSNGANATVTDRFFGDTFSDGPLATAPASGANSANGRCLWLTT